MMTLGMEKKMVILDSEEERSFVWTLYLLKTKNCELDKKMVILDSEEEGT